MAVLPKLVDGQYVWLNSLVSASPVDGGEITGNRHLAHIDRRLPADTLKWRRGEIETSFIRRAKSPADRLP
ncbi:hypothetical protein [Mycolicibacterium phocaicum]|uniref:hypothetical protein n=1 Tax=Mycolicibacterium phocaicum TaxID=319706 RepID=UPI0010FF2E7E|nr:hypothetical protein [Mycolicibacterium phocaicum]